MWDPRLPSSRFQLGLEHPRVRSSLPGEVAPSEGSVRWYRLPPPAITTTSSHRLVFLWQPEAMSDDIPERIVQTLGLVPYPTDGGRFVESYRSSERIDDPARDPLYRGPRSHSTAITSSRTRSFLGRCRGHAVAPSGRLRDRDPDQLGHFHRGQAPGPDPQGCVAGAWLAQPDGYGLLGCTVAPEIELEDYESGDLGNRTGRYPEFAAEIRALTTDSA